VDHHEEGLLERVADRRGLGEQLVEQLLELLRDREGLVRGPRDRDLDPAVQ
jgi:hypothetical protein